MTFVQAVFEFSIELQNFYNIDLFQRGYYQLRLSLKVPSRSTSKIEVSHSISARDSSNRSLTRSASSTHNSFPPCIVEGSAVSRTFQVLYKNERVDLNDIITFRTYSNLDVSRCVEQVSTTEFILNVELWFTEHDFAPSSVTSLDCVSSRELLLHVDLCKGLHHHRPVLFDYFHLSAITLSIHASLTSFGRPFTGSKPKPNEPEASSITYTSCGYDQLVFDCSLDTINAMEWSQMQLRLRRAQLIHWQLCSILFAHLSCLSERYSDYKHLTSSKKVAKRAIPPPSVHLNGTNIVPNARSMSNLAQVCYQCSLENAHNTDFDLAMCHRDLSIYQKKSDSPLLPVNQYRPLEYITMIESDLIYISTLCRLQFEQFLTLVIGNKLITRHLAELHHMSRIRRFAEAFFLVTKSRDEIKGNMDLICDTFNNMSESLRRSAYFQLLPKCHVECKSLDGESTTLPIIYQENFDPVDSKCQVTTVQSIESSFSKLLLNNSREQKSRVSSSDTSDSVFHHEKDVMSRPLPEIPSNDVQVASKVKHSVDEEQGDSSANDVTKLTTCQPSASEDKCIISKRSSSTSHYSIGFVEAREEFRHNLPDNWKISSDLEWCASSVPYFEFDKEGLRSLMSPDQHLIICVHGLDGNSADLRMVRAFLELALPSCDLVFLMSQRNQGETFDCLDVLTERLAQEIINHIQTYRLRPAKVSFIGHSLGNIIIRSVLARPELEPLKCKFHTFLSLSGPHLGTLYNPSGLINLGLWIFQKWKKSASLLQLSMKDNVDPRKSFLYKLSEIKLDCFKNVVLFGSSQDNYVPIHSAHINPCTASLNDTSPQGVAYREMIDNLLKPIASNNSCRLVRFDVHHALSSNTSSLIGRAAHIAVLDSELFIEKFMAVCGVTFFT